MLNYIPQNQLDIFNFKTEFESKLDPNNRWVKMAKLLEWDKFAMIYGENFSSTMGAKGVNARIVIGALIIKHIEAKDDRGTIEAIKENQYIKFPTDLSLLNYSREKSEELVDQLCLSLGLTKPRTYRRLARKSWLNISKSKKPGKKKIQIGIKKQLNYLKRNLKSIDKILDENPLSLYQLDNKQYRYLLVIKELYKQQLEMFQEKKHSIPNRIVSIHQPHIRPMVRGKQGKNVEFGAKINVSLQQGYATIDQLNFEAFNEGIYLKEQVENYKKRNGYYPELVQTDEIYMNRENRNYLKERSIRHTGKPLGRKPKEDLSRYQKEKLKKERGERNHIEGKFGQGKSKYKLNKILARLDQTSESWIAAIFFVMNILKLSKEYFWLVLNRLIFKLFLKNNHYKIQYSTKLNPIIA